MAIYRSVYTNFWIDTKVVDKFTPEDKYFMLYCLTNPYTNLVGCYEISVKQMSNDLGYSKDTVESLLKRFIEVHNIIDYDFDTKELFVKHWYKYNWSNSPKLEKPLIADIEKIKTPRFKEELIEIYNSRDTVCIPYVYGMDTTVTDTVSDTNTITDIINYLNNKINSKYRVQNKVTQKHINARIKEGFKIEDFKKVIDKQYVKWYGTDMQQYLRPETLFGTKFEGYLNAPTEKGKKDDKRNEKTYGGLDLSRFE